MKTVPVPAVDLNGLIDIHLHTGPDIRPRFADDLDTARAARDAGLRAILIKSHVTLTSDRAAIAEKAVEGIRVFGGLALNYAVGGLNPAAVEAAITMGARVIWMPTLDAAHHRSEHGRTGGISILDGEGRIRREVGQIVKMVKEADVMLGTGHISIPETAALVKLAREMKLQRIVVTHPEAPFIRMDSSNQRGLAGDGVFFERCYVNTTAETGSTVGLAGIAAQIREVGVDSTVISTDFGQASNPAPTDGLRACVAGLMELGFGSSEIRRMLVENPAYLLGIQAVP